MTDEDKCSRAATLFYQHISDNLKKNPDFIIEDMAAFAHEWAMVCGFDHPRCFVNYILDTESERKTEQESNERSG